MGSCEQSLGTSQHPRPQQGCAVGSSAHHLLAMGATWLGHGSLQQCQHGALQPQGGIFTALWSCRQPNAGQRDRASNQSYLVRKLPKWILLTGSCLSKGRKTPLKEILGRCGILCLDTDFHPSRWSCGAAAGRLRAHGASHPQLTEPLDGCICWQLKKKRRIKQFPAPVVIFPFFLPSPALPQLGAVAVAWGGAPLSPGCDPH